MRFPLVVLLVPMLSGCLADDIWREPFDWDARPAFGANVDEAQAFAGAIQDLGDRGQQTGDDVVVGQAEDLPNNVVFQNMREFLNEQSPGRGDQVHENITDGTGQVRDGYVTLTGPAADAYRNATTSLDGTGGVFTFDAPDRTIRVRFQLDILIAQAPPQGENDSPVGNVQIQITNPRGAVVIDRIFDRTTSYQDMFIEGTYGDDNQVREDLAGTWRIEVSATGEGAWSVASETWQPRHADYEWWQFWRGEKRVVVGQ